MDRWWRRGPFAGGSLRGVLARLAVLNALVLALLLLMAIGTAVLTAREYRDAGQLGLARQGAANQVLIDLLNAETGSRGYTFTGRGDYLTPYAEARERYPDDVERLRRATSGSQALADRVDIVEGAADLWLEEAQLLVDLRRTEGPVAADARARAGRADQLFLAFRRAHSDLLVEVDRERRRAIDAADRVRDIATAGVVVSGLGMLLMLLFANRQIRRRVGRPLSAVSEGLMRVTRGSLSDPVPRQDHAVREVRDLVDGFNDMQRQVFQQRDAVAAAARRESAQKTERRLWETVQSELLPDRLPRPWGIRLAAAYQPAEKALLLGGDFYDALMLDSERMAVLVGDMAGHGAPAAARATGLRFAWRTLVASDPDPGAVMTALNAQLADREDRAEGLFASLVYALVSIDGLIQYAPAGHPPPLLLGPDGCRVEEPASWGPLLGVMDEAEWPVTELRLERGSTLVFYTDGLVEARAGADLFGAERACRILERDRTIALEGRVQNLIDAARRHDTHHLNDDVVVMAIDRPPRITAVPRGLSTPRAETEAGVISRA